MAELKPTLRELSARRSLRARQVLHGATNERNAARVLQLIGDRKGAAGLVAARRAVEKVPAVIRSEASVARATAADIAVGTAEADARYQDLIEKAAILDRWAELSEFASVKSDVLAVVRKLVLAEQT